MGRGKGNGVAGRMGKWGGERAGGEKNEDIEEMKVVVGGRNEGERGGCGVGRGG